MAPESGRATARIAGAILAGGKATRYGGIQKALLEAEPAVPFIVKQIRALSGAGISKVVVSASDEAPFESFGVPVIPDRRRDYGPLSGIASVLRELAADYDAVLFVPCDLPGIGPAEVRSLIEAFRASTRPVVVARLKDDTWRPLLAVVSMECLPQLTHAITDDRLRVRPLWEEIGCETVVFEDPKALINVNCASDLAQWRSLWAWDVQPSDDDAGE